ncbi:MAG: hypothetical protein GXC76_16695 [Rhodanobacteraceae bacterium]|jgi:hypothetical protein|nr:hypothetical protein [Rhodanobacteraceae bacterium]
MADAIAASLFPTLYVRGHAATMAEIEDTTADPYMGFNRGATLLRQDADKQPVRFIFESPLLRLIKDHGYEDAFRNGGSSYEPGEAPARSIWVFRYYERVSESLGNGQRVPLEQFAVDLRRFILEVREAICGNDAAQRAAFKVYLVAHSMGGLVCRCYLQNLCRHGAPHATDNAALELVPGGANASLVDKVYTFGTPHNGIDLAGVNAPNLGGLDALQLANFNRDRMREYLRLPKQAAVNDLDGAFPPERFFCFIGSNHKDYDAFFGMSRHAAGPMSDGLVLMENAYVQGAPRAVGFRSHSGPQGIVNSEAGYQNLRRFLFGQWRITATLDVDALPLARPVQEKKDAGAQIRGSYYFDVATQVRGAANYYLNERRYGQQSAVLKTYDELTKDGQACSPATCSNRRAARTTPR